MRLFKILPVLLFLLLFVYACGSGSGTDEHPEDANDPVDEKVTFSESDYEGEWSFINWLGSGTKDGSFTIDNTGSITGGNWTVIGDKIGEFKDGWFSVKESGEMLGTVRSEDGNVYTFKSGQLSINKDLASYVTVDNLYNEEAGIAIKVDGAFLLADLAGTWSLAAPDRYGTFTIDDTGKITEGNMKYIGGNAENITGDSLGIDELGNISGNFITGDLDEYRIQSGGRMNSGKNIILGIIMNVTSDINEGVAFIAVKRNGSFDTADLEGTFKLVHIRSNNSFGYGEIEIDDSGNVTGGSWTKMGDTSGAFTSGTVSISDEGVIDKVSIDSSNGERHKILKGQISPDKIIAVISSDTSGTPGLIVLIKTP